LCPVHEQVEILSPGLKREAEAIALKGPSSASFNLAQRTLLSQSDGLSEAPCGSASTIWLSLQPKERGNLVYGLSAPIQLNFKELPNSRKLCYNSETSVYQTKPFKK
jgi:hypothetical protein